MIWIIALVLGIVCAVLASSRGRSPIAWFFIGFLFGIFALIVLLVLPNLAEQREKEAHDEMERRRLQELLRQEQLKNEQFRKHAHLRLDAHDARLGMDTRDSEALPEHASDAPSALPGAGDGAAPADAPEQTHGWYYQRDREAIGPIYLTSLRQMFLQGRLAMSTRVWHESLGDWTPAQEVGPLNMEIDSG